MINHGGDICPRENKEVPRPVANLTLTTATPAMVFKANSFQTLNTLTMLSLPPLFPKEKRSVQIREISTFPSPTKVSSVRRERKEEEELHGKRAKHVLALVSLHLNLEEMGFTIYIG